MKLLKELYFIDIKPGRSGPISHVIIWNPHPIIAWHHNTGTPGLMEASFNMLLERALEIGARDMVEAAQSVLPAAAS